MNTSSPKSKKTSLFSPIYFLFSLISNFLYNKLPQEWSPSTKKGVVQISGALAITCVIVSGVAFGEAILKEDEAFKTVNQLTSEVKTQDVINKNNQNNQDKNKTNIIAPLAEVDNKKQETRTDDTNCNYKFNLGIFLCPFSDSKLLGQVQNIGVIAAAILFFMDVFDRKKQLERQAWQLIDGAQGSETSGARKQAIEDLYAEKADITGLDADGADLREINLSGADLTRASFKKAILEGANFERAILYEADFTGANLKGVNLSGANLIGANFTEADLTELIKNDNKSKNNEKSKTNLKGANLGRATLKGADLCDVDFGEYTWQESGEKEYTNLNGVNFRYANIRNVYLKNISIAQSSFGGAKIGENQLDIALIKEAKNFQEAFYGRDFCEAYHKAYPNSSLQEDKEYERQLQQRISKDKIPEISQHIKTKILTSPQDEDILPDLIMLLDSLEKLCAPSEQEPNDTSQRREIRNKTVDVKNKLIKLHETQQEGESLLDTKPNLDRQKQLLKIDIDRLDEEAKCDEEKINNSNLENNIP